MAKPSRSSTTLRAVSMDKGFYSPVNLAELKSRLECVVLPKKVKLSKADKARESEPEFVNLRKQHPAGSRRSMLLKSTDWTNVPITVSTNLNATSPWAVVASNIQRLGVVYANRRKRQLNENVDLTKKQLEKL